jgi:PKD repeat protein
VNELEIYYNDAQPTLSKLRAATSGRGLWESDLYSPPNIAPVADFTADITNPGIGQIVSFTDMSANLPTSWSWTISPATFEFIEGTDYDSQNPKVKFNETGSYSVNLYVENAYGNDSENKPDYINVSLLPSYCSASGGGTIYISGVTLGSISNTGTGDDHYTDYSDTLSTQLTAGGSSLISVHLGSYASPRDSLGGWIDWNHDGDFDDINEAVFNIEIVGFDVSATIVTPHDAKLGFTKMRIRDQHYGSLLPCGNTTYGEVEDYAIEVKPGSNTWVGTTTQWNDASNWSAGVVPTSSYNVIIPASPTGGNFPEIPSGLTAKCNKLTLENNATITINGDIEIE